MAIRIETRQPSALIVVLSLVVVIAAIVAHLMPSVPIAPWLKRYDFWILGAGYTLLLWRTLF